MSPSEQLSSILKEKYVTPDGSKFRIVLNVGLTEKEVQSLIKRLGVPKFPQEIHSLLKMTSGFEFYGLKEIRFDNINIYGYEDLFPRAITLAEDDFGNFWTVDIDKEGNWGSVFYVSHEPPVIVKHSENITEFIRHVDEFGKKWHDSNFEQIHEKRVLDIWENRIGLVNGEASKISRDSTLREFACSLPENCLIADLRKKPVQSGFVWGSFGSRAKIIRHGSEYLWAIHRPERKSLFSMMTPGLNRTLELGRNILTMRMARNFYTKKALKAH